MLPRSRPRSRAFAALRDPWVLRLSVVGRFVETRLVRFAVEITTAHQEKRRAVEDEGKRMRKAGKHITKAREAVEKRPYVLGDAVPLLQKVKFAKFDETVEITLRLGEDPKHADQMVRGAGVLPHGLGKSKKVLVIASGDKVKEAEAAGAGYVGGEDMGEKTTKENRNALDG